MELSNLDHGILLHCGYLVSTVGMMDISMSVDVVIILLLRPNMTGEASYIHDIVEAIVVLSL